MRAALRRGVLRAENSAYGRGLRDGSYPRELADVNRDGQANIVGFGEAGSARLKRRTRTRPVLQTIDFPRVMAEYAA